jgi:hypothetical protein
LLVKSIVKVGHEIQRGPINQDGCSTLSMYTIYIGNWSFLLAKHGHSQHGHNQGWGEGEYAATWVDCHVDIKNVGWCEEVLEP